MAETQETRAKLETLIESLKNAFRESHFDEVHRLAGEIRALDPENSLAAHVEKKVAEKEIEAIRQAHKEEIEALEKNMKAAFKEARFGDLRQAAAELKKIDPQSEAAGKWVRKADETEVTLKAEAEKAAARLKEKEANEKKKAEERLLQEKLDGIEKAIKAAWKASDFAGVRAHADELRALNPEAAEKWVKKADETEVKLKTEAEDEAAKQKERAGKEALRLKEKEEEAKQKAEKEAARLKEAEVKEKQKSEAKANHVPWSVRLQKVRVAVSGVWQKFRAKPVQEPSVYGPETQAMPDELQKNGNIFTRLFQKKAEEAKEESIIETIVSQADQKKEQEQKEPEDVTLKWLSLARLFFQFSVVFVLLTAAFLYAQVVDRSNTVMGLFGVESNFASRLHSASERLGAEKERGEEIKKEIEVYQKGYNNQYEKTIQKVVSQRVDWTEVINKINEVADSVYEHNALSQYIKFSGYSFNAPKKQVTVSGTLSDPLGQNLTKLTELEEAFRYYPKDKDDPDDKTPPYFYGIEGASSVGKSLSQKDNKYLSTFRFTFYLEKQTETKKPDKSKKK